MLSLKKDDDIVILGIVNSDWLVGYKESKSSDADNELFGYKKEQSELGIIPLSFLRLKYYNLPRPKRQYQILNW